MSSNDSELQSQAEQLSIADAEVILGRLPERLRTALINHAAEIEYPIEAVIEMAIAQASKALQIASFLDTEYCRRCLIRLSRKELAPVVIL